MQLLLLLVLRLPLRKAALDPQLLLLPTLLPLPLLLLLPPLFLPLLPLSSHSLQLLVHPRPHIMPSHQPWCIYQLTCGQDPV
jgi:hypothetical protein